MYTEINRIAELAKEDPKRQLHSIAHLITVAKLKEAFRNLRKDASAGIDGVTYEQYETNVEENVRQLHKRLKEGKYQAQPLRRVYIPKEDGKQRPISIPTLEDKVAQKAVVDLLNAIYEQDFLDCSYGFRPKRSAHQALQALWVQTTKVAGGWVIEVDARKFFDTMDHGWMMRFLEHRIGDRRIHRLMRKWLRAGVSEDGTWTKTEVGTPQGAVISPLLANVYLHYVFDLWVRRWRRRSATGDMMVVRYADDIVLGFEYRADAERFLDEWRDRMRSFGLDLHPDKTRLIEFGRHAARNRKQRGERKPETFDFLGFTHLCGKTSKRGHFMVLRKTVGKRIRAKLQQIKQLLLARKHDPVQQTGEWLRTVVQGYFNYHAVPGNGRRMGKFREQVARYWRLALRRRSQKSRMTWDRFRPLAQRWIPVQRVLHPFPRERFDAIHPR